MAITFFLLGITSPILFAFIAAIAIYGWRSLYLNWRKCICLYGATKAIVILIIGFSLNIFTDNNNAT